MIKVKRVLGLIVILALLISGSAPFLASMTALAQPVVPLQYEGNVTIGGSPAPIGTIISAEIAGEEVATNAPDGISQEGYYRLDVSANEGDVVDLKVNGVVGGQATYTDPMSTWHVVCDLAIEGVTYTLTMAVVGEGTVTPAVGDHIYLANTVVDITASPASEWEFSGWSTGDMMEIADATSASTTLTLDKDKTVTATFTVSLVELESSGSLAKAAFTPTDLSISPSEVNIGETVAISVLVTNTGSASGSYKVTLKINGVVEATKEVTLNAGASKEVTFTAAKDVAASYSVDVNGLSGSFSIREKPAPPPPPEEVPPVEVNWPLIGGIVAGVVIVGLLIFFLVRRRAV